MRVWEWFVVVECRNWSITQAGEKERLQIDCQLLRQELYLTDQPEIQILEGQGSYSDSQGEYIEENFLALQKESVRKLPTSSQEVPLW